MVDKETSAETSDTGDGDTTGTILNISEAARLGGVARTTLYRHIQSGKVSVVTTPDGGRGIELSELLRAYGDGGKAKGASAPKNAPTVNTERVIQLDADLRVEKARVSMLEAQLAESLQRETWQREQIDKLLTYQPNAPHAGDSNTSPPRMTLRKLFGNWISGGE